MKAQDLRIGNYVFEEDCHPNYFAIEQITKSGNTHRIHYRYNSISSVVEDVIPLKLTEEWLLKFGFEYGEQRGYFPPKYFKKYTPVLVENKFEVEFIDATILMWLEGNTNVHMKYVHQLQNLYFALTGEELIINPDKPKE